MIFITSSRCRSGVDTLPDNRGTPSAFEPTSVPVSVVMPTTLTPSAFMCSSLPATVPSKLTTPSSSTSSPSAAENFLKLGISSEVLNFNSSFSRRSSSTNSMLIDSRSVSVTCAFNVSIPIEPSASEIATLPCNRPNKAALSSASSPSASEVRKSISPFRSTPWN